MQRINSNRFNFADDVKKLLKDYHGECVEALTKVIPEVAKEATKKLKDESPKDSGEYAKHWTYTVNTGRLTTGAVVYGNAPTYRMAHLLENGHAKRGGGRTAPIVHIYPVMEWATDEVENRFIDEVERIVL